MKNNQTKDKAEELLEISMEIILKAGDARNEIYHALDCVANKNFEEAEQALDKANEELTKAHDSQTKIIQSEIRGDKYPSTFLFAHAQDTLMTIKSEYNLTNKLISIFKNYK